MNQELNRFQEVQALRRAHTLLRALWECRVAVVIIVLHSVFLNLEQTAEFLDRFLFVCGSQPDACGESGGLRGTNVQFAMFLVSSFLLGSLVRVAAREALSDRRGNSVGGHDTSLVNQLVPHVLGALPVVLTSYLLLFNAGYANSSRTAIVAIAYVTLIAVAPSLLKRRMRQDTDYLLMSLLGAGVVSLAALAGTGDVIGTFSAFGSVGAFLGLAAWATSLLGAKRSMLLVSIVLAVVLMIGALGSIGSASLVASHAPFWTTQLIFLTPALFFLHLFSAGILKKGMRKYLSRTMCRGYLRICRVLNRLAPERAPDVIILFFGVLVLSVPAFVWMAGDPIGASMLFIAPTSVTFALTALLVAWTLCLWLLSRMHRWLILLLVLAASSFTGVPPAPLSETESIVRSGTCDNNRIVCDLEKQIWNRYLEWERMHGSSKTSPIILVATAGGGSRAAAHTVSALGGVDGATCGAFGDRIFAISGVSGGAVGATLYAANRRDVNRTAERESCLRTVPQERAYGRVSGLVSVATSDHLSAMVNRALTRDLVTSLLPSLTRMARPEITDFASRGGMLEQSLLIAYTEYLSKQQKGIAVTNSLLGDELARDSAAPMLLYNATSVQDGQRVILSQPLVCPRDGWCAQPAGLLVNATDSARFPLISPARARNVFHWNDYLKQVTVSERALVDGGYFDNSGVTTLLDVIRVLLDKGVDPSRLVAVLISSNPEEGKLPASVQDYAHPGWLTQLLTPVQTITAVRDGRSLVARRELEHMLGFCNVVYWPMSTLTLNPPSNEVQERLNAIPELDAINKLHGRDFAVDTLERAPALGWALSSRSAGAMIRLAYRHGMPYAYGDFAFDNELRLATLLGYKTARLAAALTKELAGSQCKLREGSARPVQ